MKTETMELRVYNAYQPNVFFAGRFMKTNLQNNIIKHEITETKDNLSRSISHVNYILW